MKHIKDLKDLAEVLGITEDQVLQKAYDALMDGVDMAICPEHGEVGSVEPDGYMFCPVEDCGMKAHSLQNWIIGVPPEKKGDGYAY